MIHVHRHHRPEQANSKRLLLIGLLLTLGFAGMEMVGGLISGSLALLGDAGHMFSDSAALTIALLAAWMMARPPSRRFSYGHGRVEVIAAIANSVFMLVVVIGIVIEAVDRMAKPESINAPIVIGVAGFGLVINIIVALVLSRDRHSLNTRAALLHVLGDLLGSVAAIISGTVIYFWGWLIVDPLVSIFICSLIVISSLRLLKEAVNIVMEGVPTHLDLHQVGEAMVNADGRARSVHDLHIWALSSGQVALSAHVIISDLRDWPDVLEAERETLAEKFDIHHITLQPEMGTQETLVSIDNLLSR